MWSKYSRICLTHQSARVIESMYSPNSGSSLMLVWRHCIYLSVIPHYSPRYSENPQGTRFMQIVAVKQWQMALLAHRSERPSAETQDPTEVRCHPGWARWNAQFFPGTKAQWPHAPHPLKNSFVPVVTEMAVALDIGSLELFHLRAPDIRL